LNVLKEKKGEGLCKDDAVSYALECALCDHVAQRSADLEKAEKRRRLSDEREEVRCENRWRETLDRLGGAFFCDGGMLEAWLDKDPKHRSLAHSLLQLQKSAVRWYGQGAKEYCEGWRVSVLRRSSDSGEPPFGQILQSELCALQETIFAYPEIPGAAPVLFRNQKLISLSMNGDDECLLTIDSSKPRNDDDDCLLSIDSPVA